MEFKWYFWGDASLSKMFTVYLNILYASHTLVDWGRRQITQFPYPHQIAMVFTACGIHTAAAIAAVWIPEQSLHPTECSRCSANNFPPVSFGFVKFWRQLAVFRESEAMFACNCSYVQLHDNSGGTGWRFVQSTNMTAAADSCSRLHKVCAGSVFNYCRDSDSCFTVSFYSAIKM